MCTFPALPTPMMMLSPKLDRSSYSRDRVVAGEAPHVVNSRLSKTKPRLSRIDSWLMDSSPAPTPSRAKSRSSRINGGGGGGGIDSVHLPVGSTFSRFNLAPPPEWPATSLAYSNSSNSNNNSNNSDSRPMSDRASTSLLSQLPKLSSRSVPFISTSPSCPDDRLEYASSRFLELHSIRSRCGNSVPNEQTPPQGAYRGPNSDIIASVPPINLLAIALGLQNDPQISAFRTAPNTWDNKLHQQQTASCIPASSQRAMNSANSSGAVVSAAGCLYPKSDAVFRPMKNNNFIGRNRYSSDLPIYVTNPPLADVMPISHDTKTHDYLPVNSTVPKLRTVILTPDLNSAVPHQRRDADKTTQPDEQGSNISMSIPTAAESITSLTLPSNQLPTQLACAVDEEGRFVLHLAILTLYKDQIKPQQIEIRHRLQELHCTTFLERNYLEVYEALENQYIVDNSPDGCPTVFLKETPRRFEE